MTTTTTTTTMSLKRKREDEPDDTPQDQQPPHKPSYPDKKTAKQVKKLYAFIDSSAKSLHRALKTARGFERQKLGRRQKNARRGDAPDRERQLGRLEEEVNALKNLDLQLLAQKHIYKSLAKVKKVAAHPAFQALRVSEALQAPPKNTEEANVTARLYASNPVRQVLPGLVEEGRGLLGVKEEGKGEEKEKGGQPEKKEEKKEKEERRDDAPAPAPARAHAVDDGGFFESMDMDMDAYDARIASSSDEDSDDEEEDEDHPPSTSAKTKTKSTSPPRANYDDISLSSDSEAIDRQNEEDQESDASSQSSDPDLAPPKSKSKPTTTDSTSTFLPSLALGGYWSGSESEPEDDAEITDLLGGGRNGQPQRRNRMGQQARRALWEKKFGREANHVRKQGEKGGKEKKGGKQKGNRDEGWDLKRGATGGDERRERQERRERREREERERGQQRQGTGQGQGKVHPSWEAKRVARERQKVRIEEVKGKKVVFD